MITYIVLNGPPRVGKSTIAPVLVRMLAEKARTYQDSFAMPMKHFVATAFGDKYQEMDKDKPRAELMGSTLREFLIDLSENHMKLHYGQDIFGRLLVHRSLRYTPPPRYVVCDDGGFEAELDACHNHYLVHVTRDGHDFQGDSRSYLPNPDYVLVNETTLDELWISVRKLAQAIQESGR